MGQRYLAEREVAPALQMGRPVEQWLGRAELAVGAIVRWLRIARTKGGSFDVSVFEALDAGRDGLFDVYAFPAADPERPFGTTQTFATSAEALRFALEQGAVGGRFVGNGVIQDEYRDSSSFASTKKSAL